MGGKRCLGRSKSFRRGVEEEVDFIVSVCGSMLQRKALSLRPAARRQVPADGFADRCRENDIPVQADEMAVVGEVGDRLDVFALFFYCVASLAQG